MKRFLTHLLAMAGAACSALPALGSADEAAQLMETYRWQSRVLVVIAPSRTDTEFSAQQAVLTKQAAALAERDFVILEVISDADVQADGKALPAHYNRALRTHWRVADDAFTIILVGKDGGEKRREHHALDATSLFATVDAMPMRQREMQR